MGRSRCSSVHLAPKWGLRHLPLPKPLPSLPSPTGGKGFGQVPTPHLPISTHASWLGGTGRARKGLSVLTQWDGDDDVVSEEGVSVLALHPDGEIPGLIPFLAEGPSPVDGPHWLVEQDSALRQR